MRYSIRPNYFAPMLRGATNTAVPNVHAIVYDKCNFKCSFCTINQRDQSEFHSYSEEEFVYIVSQLVMMGKSFKFTGGEPTLNPRLVEDMMVVKDLGGSISLDTNGSRPVIIRQLIELGLIDTLGVSIKGLTPQNAQHVSGIAKPALYWENVFESIQLACDNEIRTIVTHVFDSSSTIEDFRTYFNMFKSCDGIELKFNNLFYEKALASSCTHVEEDNFVELIRKLLSEYILFTDHIIIAPNDNAVTQNDAFIFM